MQLFLPLGCSYLDHSTYSESYGFCKKENVENSSMNLSDDS